MSVADAAVAAEIELFRRQARLVRMVVEANTAGLTHRQSLIQPAPAGNCLNWVLGHVLQAYNGFLPLLDQEPVLPAAVLERYQRGSRPLTDEAEALHFDELRRAWDEAVERMDVGLGGLNGEKLAQPAPFSPGADPDETVRSLVGVVLFHQTYHGGQMGVLRRLIGEPGAIP